MNKDRLEARQRMVQTQIAARGVRDPAVLRALEEVPREAFVSADLAEFAYEDAPLPIEEGQTISQPFIVALTIEALKLRPESQALEIGAGSGYAAAVMSRIASEVYTVERNPLLAEQARRRCKELGYDNVHVLCGDGTLGWPEHAPYDGIAVAAGGPIVPPALREQLAAGGRLVVPVGGAVRSQELLLIEKTERGFHEESLGAVTFVPLIGAGGWDEALAASPKKRERGASALVRLLRETTEPIRDIESAPLDSLLRRIGDARVVLLGEATHGTSEFYRMRARITSELVEKHGFNIVAVEADWPDAARIDHHVRHLPFVPQDQKAFTRFPSWMWRNQEVHDFVAWLREHNSGLSDPRRQVGFYGLDLYSLFTSRDVVLRYLDQVDPDAARVARQRYGCLSPWESDPATYGRAALSARYHLCEKEVVAMLSDMVRKQMEYSRKDGERFIDALQNAQLVANAERYYRIMYYGSRQSWNLRDQHMFDTLELLLEHRGADARAVVWEHNSHIGDASVTEMGAQGEHNVGQLCRARHGEGAYLLGFGTDHGTVAAASEWDGPMEIMSLRPARDDSYEHLFHRAELPACLLHFRRPVRSAVVEELTPPRLERAVGVIYRPDTELASHYFSAVLPRQFDSYCWFDETSAVAPLGAEHAVGVPDTYPFGL